MVLIGAARRRSNQMAAAKEKPSECFEGG